MKITNGKTNLIGNIVFQRHPVHTGAFSCPIAEVGDFEGKEDGKMSANKILIKKQDLANHKWW